MPKLCSILLQKSYDTKAVGSDTVPFVDFVPVAKQSSQDCHNVRQFHLIQVRWADKLTALTLFCPGSMDAHLVLY